MLFCCSSLTHKSILWPQVRDLLSFFMGVPAEEHSWKFPKLPPQFSANQWCYSLHHVSDSYSLISAVKTLSKLNKNIFRVFLGQMEVITLSTFVIPETAVFSTGLMESFVTWWHGATTTTWGSASAEPTSSRKLQWFRHGCCCTEALHTNSTHIQDLHNQHNYSFKICVITSIST